MILISAHDPASEQDRAWEAGVEAFLREPFEYAEFVSAIRKALGHPA